MCARSVGRHVARRKLVCSCARSQFFFSNHRSPASHTLSHGITTTTPRPRPDPWLCSHSHLATVKFVSAEGKRRRGGLASRGVAASAGIYRKHTTDNGQPPRPRPATPSQPALVFASAATLNRSSLSPASARACSVGPRVVIDPLKSNATLPTATRSPAMHARSFVLPRLLARLVPFSSSPPARLVFDLQLLPLDLHQ